MKTKPMTHTINLAAAPILTIFDDYGQIVYTLMLPICLISYLPCRLYTTWQTIALYLAPLTRCLAAIYNILFGPGWLADLRFMALALLSLFLFPPLPVGEGLGVRA